MPTRVQVEIDKRKLKLKEEEVATPEGYIRMVVDNYFGRQKSHPDTIKRIIDIIDRGKMNYILTTGEGIDDLNHTILFLFASRKCTDMEMGFLREGHRLTK